jgi:hypothetical protein
MAIPWQAEEEQASNQAGGSERLARYPMFIESQESHARHAKSDSIFPLQLNPSR